MKYNLLGLGAIALLLSLASCGEKTVAPQGPPPATPVGVYQVQTGNATYYDNYPATVTALNQVDIKPQVSGNITQIFFQDGQHVRKGQKLYQIDQQQYGGAYEQALANLEVSKATLAKSQQDADRYIALDKQDAIAKQILDHQLADLQVAKRQVDAAKANVSSVQTSLKYSTIYAPFDGTIGISLVKVGTSVYAQTLLNTVSSDDPIAVDVAIDQSQIPRFVVFLGKGVGVERDSIFTIQMQDLTKYSSPGYLSLLDRAVDPNTGTIKARLIFPNHQKLLKVGFTCNVQIKNNGGDSSLLIPYKAVTQQLGENFVFVVVNKNDTTKQVLQRKVELGTKIMDKIVVKQGLEKGQIVVTEGNQKLKDSSIVKVGPQNK